MEKIGLRFFLEKGNLPEKTIFYINQGYLSYKDNKKIYYNDVFILGQITPLLNQPQNIEEYVPKEDEVKILRPKYDIKTGTVLGIESCLSYLLSVMICQSKFLIMETPMKIVKFCTVHIK